jgi:hypothetical protein
MINMIGAHKIFSLNTGRKKPVGGLRVRCEDNNEIGFQELKC